MHEQERIRIILDMIRTKSAVSIREIIAHTGASMATVRRDIIRLESLGTIRRLRGGIQAAGVPDVSQPVKQHFVAPIWLSAAADFCSAGDAIILTAGEFTPNILSFLTNIRMKIMTNSVKIAQTALNTTQSEVSVLNGGEVMRGSELIYSYLVGESRLPYKASNLFFECDSISDQGVMISDPCDASATLALLENARDLIVIAPHTAFRYRPSYLICPLAKLRAVIAPATVTDAILQGLGISPELVKRR